MKIDRWGWQPDNSPSSSFPHSPVSSTSSHCTVPSLCCTAFPVSRCSPYLSFFTPHQNTHCQHVSQKLSCSPYFIPFHSFHSFTLCHYGPMLIEAFIKCQLYTRDHTVEGEDTMISDPKRSTCLWPFKSCWREVCLL